MPFEPGKSGNPGGRPMGAKNKITTELGRYIIGEGAEKAMRILQELDGAEYIVLYEKLKQYYVPKRKAVESIIDIHTLTAIEVDTLIDKILDNGSRQT